MYNKKLLQRVGAFLFLVLFMLGCNAFSAAPVSTETPAPSPSPFPTDTPQPTSIPEQITDQKGAVMRLVPEGKFQMGSDKSPDEQPVHEVFLESYYMDVYEVTNSAYKQCEKDKACTSPLVKGMNPNYYKLDDVPVVYVTWRSAKGYCEWRGARLPTEAEWEKAARGEHGRTFPWGDDYDCDRANSEDCRSEMADVGDYESGKSPYGIYDMTGNVWEWVSTLQSVYPYDPNDGRENLTSSIHDKRGLRGGGYDTLFENSRASKRSWQYDDFSYFNTGFRCARDVNP